MSFRTRRLGALILMEIYLLLRVSVFYSVLGLLLIFSSFPNAGNLVHGANRSGVAPVQPETRYDIQILRNIFLTFCEV